MRGLLLVLGERAELPPGQAQGPLIPTLPSPVPTHEREAFASL